jgi:hypothetical protein
MQAVACGSSSSVSPVCSKHSAIGLSARTRPRIAHSRPVVSQAMAEQGDWAMPGAWVPPACSCCRAASAAAAALPPLPLHTQQHRRPVPPFLPCAPAQEQAATAMFLSPQPPPRAPRPW